MIKLKISHTFLISFLCLFFLISSASALTYNIPKNPKGVNVYIPLDSAGREPGIDFIAFNDTTAVIIHGETYQSSRNLLTGITGLYDIISTGDYIFLAKTDGSVYRLNNNEGNIQWDAESAVHIGKLGSPGAKLVYHTDGYVYTIRGTKLYRIDPETCLYTISSEAAPSAWNIGSTPDGIETITGARMPDGTYVRISTWDTFNSFTDKYIYIYSTTRSIDNIYEFVRLADNSYIISYHLSTPNANYYYVSTFSNGNISHIKTQLGSPIYFDFAVNNKGVIAIAVQNNYIEFIDNNVPPSTLAGYGGHFKPADIVYDKAEVFTYYSVVHNGTPIDILYNVHIDTQKNKAIGNIDTITNRYNWEIDIIAPDGTRLNTYKIPETFKQKGLLSSVFTTTGNIALTPRVNGTYILRLYEVDANTQEKALLKESTFKVLFESGSAGGEITDRDNVNIVTNFLQSPYFIALIIIGVVVFQFGRDARGQINGSAMVVLVPLAVALTCMMGLLPMWILYLMAMLVIAFIAWSVSE